jgi:hypothetical protein
MNSTATEIKIKIFDALATGEYDLFDILLGLTQVQQMILESFNAGDLEESDGYAQFITPEQQQDIKTLDISESAKPASLSQTEPLKPTKKKSELPPDLGVLDFEAFESPL